MPKIAIANRQKAVRVSPARLQRLIEFVARTERRRIVAVDLAVVAPAEIADLNRRYRRRARPTDVLSFDLSEAHSPGVVAQLVVCGDLAAAEGPPHGHRPGHELMLYVIHALLHLMGYADAPAAAAARMRARQAELLAAFLRRKARPRRRPIRRPAGRGE